MESQSEHGGYLTAGGLVPGETQHDVIKEFVVTELGKGK
jgi:hypothetical protein